MAIIGLPSLQFSLNKSLLRMTVMSLVSDSAGDVGLLQHPLLRFAYKQGAELINKEVWKQQ